MSHSIETMLQEVEEPGSDLQRISPTYIRELRNYLNGLDKRFPEKEKRDQYVHWYAGQTKKALQRAQVQGGLGSATANQIRALFRRMEEDYQIITALPIVVEEVHDCLITGDGRVVRPYLILPNQQKIPLYQNE